MMTFFPTPLNEELLYSILARYHIFSGNNTLADTMKDIYNNHMTVASVMLPARMNLLVENLPKNNLYSADYFIEEHTLYKYFVAFFDAERRDNIRNLMKKNNGGLVHAYCGLRRSNYRINDYLKICPKCMINDMETGFLTWKRVHQLNISLCPFHDCALYNTKIPLKNINRHAFVPLKKELFKTMTIIDYNKEKEQILQKISLMSQELLDMDIVAKDREWFKTQYIELLKIKGYCNVNGVISRSRLLEDMESFFSMELLSTLNCEFNIQAKQNWVLDLVRKNKSDTSTIKHLIMIIFLESNINEIFNLKLTYQPFGSGPYPCLNHFCKDYMKSVINMIDYSYYDEVKRTLGTFKCHCGYTYKLIEGKSLSSALVVDYGELWLDRLENVLEKKLSLNKTAKSMYIHKNTLYNALSRYSVKHHFIRKASVGRKYNC
ncbi:TnsD family Tn7-like transposition protein [Petrocella sp. FN5]|uniref:TnsD family Tn7-like transposition protein n=1 Tax=Petrocella sp. FN5 TaxID=3032002 RepID=UPI0023DA2161|nr:TnsD family Tn7-like transposition protein [Petrocella sp. FN5]MDF1617312.1 TnsD family Tn7-like transposition protein [Petrocella sp. FN5]